MLPWTPSDETRTRIMQRISVHFPAIRNARHHLRSLIGCEASLAREGNTFQECILTKAIYISTVIFGKITRMLLNVTLTAIISNHPCNVSGVFLP